MGCRTVSFQGTPPKDFPFSAFPGRLGLATKKVPGDLHQAGQMGLIQEPAHRGNNMVYNMHPLQAKEGASLPRHEGQQALPTHRKGVLLGVLFVTLKGSPVMLGSELGLLTSLEAKC